MVGYIWNDWIYGMAEYIWNGWIYMEWLDIRNGYDGIVMMTKQCQKQEFFYVYMTKFLLQSTSR